MANAIDVVENSTVRFRPKWPDLFIFLIIVFTSFAPFLMGSSKGEYYSIKQDNEIIFEGELDRDTTFTVEGDLGPVTIVIQDGKIGILESNCPHKYCIEMGLTDGSEKPIVCIPNDLIIEVKSESQFDAILR